MSKLRDHAWMLLPLTTFGGLIIIISSQFSKTSQPDMPDWVTTSNGCMAYIQNKEFRAVVHHNYEGIKEYCSVYGK